MKTDYLRETHHEFLAASEEALADARLQQILGQLGDTLGRRNREAWAAAELRFNSRASAGHQR